MNFFRLLGSCLILIALVACEKTRLEDQSAGYRKEAGDRVIVRLLTEVVGSSPVSFHSTEQALSIGPGENRKLELKIQNLRDHPVDVAFSWDAPLQQVSLDECFCDETLSLVPGEKRSLTTLVSLHPRLPQEADFVSLTWRAATAGH